MDGYANKEKSKLTLSLNKDVIQRAKAAGINISEITEKMLTAVTLTPVGNSYDDVIEAYMAFFESIKSILRKYNAEVTVQEYGRASLSGKASDYIKFPRLVLNETGFWRENFDDSEEEEKYDLPVRVGVRDVWQIINLLTNPIDLLDKVIKAVIEAAERNKEQLAKLQFALKLVKALSEEEKGDSKD